MAERKAFLVRIAPEVHEALRRLAAQEMRSVNGQVEFMLREALRKRGLLKEAPPADRRRS